MLPTTWLGGGPCDSRAQMTAGADGGQLRSGGVDHETQVLNAVLRTPHTPHRL